MGIIYGTSEGPVLKPMLYLVLVVIWQKKYRMSWQKSDGTKLSEVIK